MTLMTKSNLLNSSVIVGLSGVYPAPEGGAGGGTGEPTPAAPPTDTTSSSSSSGTPAPGDAAKGIESTPEADENGSMFAMPSDDALFTLDEEGETSPGTTTNTPAAPPAASAPPVTPPAAVPGAPPQATPPAAAAPPSVSSQAAPATPPVQGQTPPTETPPTEVQSPYQNFLSLVDQNREQLATQMQQVYAISDADAEALGIVNKAPLERLAANLHVNVMRAQAAMLMQTLPTAVAQVVERLQKVETATSAFYAANKELNRDSDHAVVEKYARLFWAANPKGTLAEFNQQVGMMAKAELNKLLAQVAPPAPPASPGMTPKKVQTPSFTPATPQSGAPSAAKPAPQGSEVWAALAEKMMNSDE